MTEEPTKICPHCHGVGHTWEHDTEPWDHGQAKELPTKHKVTCSLCKGKRIFRGEHEIIMLEVSLRIAKKIDKIMFNAIEAGTRAFYGQSVARKVREKQE